MEVDVERFFDELVRLEMQLWSAVDARLRDSHDLPLSWFEPLRVVQTTPRCRVSDIVGALGITVGGASKLVDRLQEAGLCERTTDPDDRRSSLIALTPAGEQVLTSARRTFRRELRSLLTGDVDGETLADLTTTLSRLRRQSSGPTNTAT